jgi:hypothetical protein
MRKTVLLVFAALLALALGPATRSMASNLAQGKVVRITLIDENGSGEDGSAQLTDMGDGTVKVELIMLNAPEGAEQPAHIHKGTCTTLDPSPAFPLETVKEGKSTTTVKTTLADLTKEKYAINVHKSVAEASVYVSCGNLPSSLAVSGETLTLAQSLELMHDQAEEILGTAKAKEADASKNAYDAYHATFAAHEDEIKAKNAEAWEHLEEAMHEVRDAVNAGKFDEAEKAAEELINEIEDAQKEMGGSSSNDAGLEGALQKLQSAAADLVRETGNKDKDGSQKAYDDYHTAFAANEAAIQAKDNATWQGLEDRMHEVRDAVSAGNLEKANEASKELQADLAEADAKLMGGQGGNLPADGAGDLYLFTITPLALLAFGMVLAGGLARRRASWQR